MSMQQSLGWWCVSSKVSDPSAFMRRMHQIGYRGVELLPEPLWDTAKAAGLTITADGVGILENSLNRRENHAEVESQFRAKAERAKIFGVPNLIVFSGNRAGLDDETGARNTIEGLKRLASIAEAAGVTAVLELLNSRVDHKDYQCDHTEWGAAVVNAVGSPRIKLLYDIYHMQIMEGDLIATIRRHMSCIGHVHTAGVPGRHDLDDEQEINYPAVMRALRDGGYRGWVAQEFVPKGDPAEAMRQAYELCKV